MRKKQLAALNEKNLILEKNKVLVYKENNNLYYFESNNKNLNYFLTIDYLEAVSALMKLKDVKDLDNLWNIEITDNMRNIVNYNSSLYWLTGGDNEWNKGMRTYNINWSEASDIFLKKFKDILVKINENCKTLGEVRTEILKYINLPILYEFGLNEGIIR